MRTFFAVLTLVALVLWPVTTLAEGLDPTSVDGIVELVVKFGLAPVGFGAIVFWLVRYHIPNQQQTFKEVITGQQASFKEAISAVIDDHKEGVNDLKAAIKAEGELNRDSRKENSEALRRTLTGLTRKQLRQADEDDSDPPDDDLPARRRTTRP